MFIISWIPAKTWTWTNSGYQVPSILSKGEKCETFKGVNFVVYWCWMQRTGAPKWRIGADAHLLLPNFYVLPTLSSQLSVFSKLSWTPFCIFSFYVSNAVVSGTYLRLDQKWLSRLAEYDDFIRGPPFLVLPPTPPYPKPTTVYNNV